MKYFLIIGLILFIRPDTNVTVAETVVENTVVETVEETDVAEEEAVISEDVLYLAKCVEAEAGNQEELGKRYVADCILNRVDSDLFPDSIVEVVNHKLGGTYQFSVVANGSINRVEVSEETLRIVLEEISERTNYEVLFFRTKHYHTFGTPVFSEGAHYFSK